MNVIEILNRYNIEYVDRGNNVAKGNVNIQCPWCGEADHSQHLGINLETGMWGCWRNVKHRGRKLHRLLSKLTGLSSAEARRATGEGELRAVQRGDMERAVQGLTEGPTAHADSTYKGRIRLPDKFREICAPGVDPYRAEARFRMYLQKERGFPKHHHKKLARQYNLHYCVSGRFADRLIIPIYEGRELMTYLGRSVYAASEMRYKALEEEYSVKQVKDCLYNYDAAMKGGLSLFITEGVFDAMKVDFYGQAFGSRAVALFNMNVEDSQHELFYELRGKFDEYIIFLDEGQVAESLNMQSALSYFEDVKIWFIKNAWGVKDPADLTPQQVRRLDGRL